MRRGILTGWDFRYGAALVLLTAIYVLAGKLGLTLAFVNTNVSAVWPATGITLAVFLTWGCRLWPAVFLGAFLVNLTTAGTVATSLGIATGNTLEGLLGAWWVNELASGRHSFRRTENVLKFIVLAALFSTIVSATIGVTSLCFGGFADWRFYHSIWLTWWLGDAVSNILIAPFLLIWFKKRRHRLDRFKIFEFILMLLVSFAVSQAVFSDFIFNRAGLPIGFLCVPVLLWGAFRFGLHGASASAFCVAVVAMWGTLQGHGPFMLGDTNDSLLLLQIFVGVITATFLVLGSIVEQSKRSEKNIRDISLRKSAILDASLDCIISMDARGRIVDFNMAAEETFGYSRRDVVGKDLAEVIIPRSLREYHRRGLNHYLKAGEGPVIGKRVEMTAIRADGTEFPVELAISVVFPDREPVFTAYLRDITERRRSKERLQLIVEASPTGLVMVGTDGKMQLVNSQMEKMFGYKREELIGKPIEMLVPERYRQQHVTYRDTFFEKVSPRPMGAGRDLYGLRKDRTEFAVEIGLNPIQTEEGIAVMASVVDITERKVAEEALRVANKRLMELLMVKDEFVASVSHELRTPLTAIKEGVGLVLDGVVGPITEEQKDFLKVTDQSIDRLAELINNLLDLSKIEAGRFRLARQRVRVKHVIDTLLNNYKVLLGKRSVRVEIREIPDVFGDPERILQIVSNLFSNAIKFTGEEGVITITAEVKDAMVFVSVQDNGIGIADEDIEKLFRKFSQVGKKLNRGTGLGLVLVKQLVEMHGGSVSLTSKLGNGSTFTFTLPVFSPEDSSEDAGDVLPEDKPAAEKRMY